MAFFKETLFFVRKNKVFSSPMGLSWEPKPIQNRSWNGVQDGWHVGIHFWMILVHFSNQVGNEIEQKSIQKGIENMIQNKSRFERVLGAFWADFRPPKKKLGDPGEHYARSVFLLKISFVFRLLFKYIKNGI